MVHRATFVRRIRWLAICLLFAAIALSAVWLTHLSPLVQAGMDKYKKLEIGMAEDDATAILGTPNHRGQRYAYWMPENHWYATGDPRYRTGPSPGEILCDHYQWDFGEEDYTSTDMLSIGMLVKDHKVICFWFFHDRHNVATRELQSWARKIWQNPPDLFRNSRGTSHDNRTEP
jgi:hypothetical protein